MNFLLIYSCDYLYKAKGVTHRNHTMISYTITLLHNSYEIEMSTLLLVLYTYQMTFAMWMLVAAFNCSMVEHALSKFEKHAFINLT